MVVTHSHIRPRLIEMVLRPAFPLKVFIPHRSTAGNTPLVVNSS